MPRRSCLLAGVLLVLGPFAPIALYAGERAQAGEENLDGDFDHDRARDLLERGEIASLHAIMAHVSSRYPGEVVAISLIRKDERWLYRFRILTAVGKLREVAVDARSMNVVSDGDGD